MMVLNKEEVGHLADAIREMKKKLEIAMEALEFYGSKNSWGRASTVREDIVIHPSDHEHYKQGGKKAREALKKIKEME